MRGGSRRPPRALLLLALAAWGPPACAGRPPAPATADVPCTAVEGSLPADATADGLAGEFRLTLVATRGARAGASTSGMLHLRRNGGGAGPAPAPGVRYPLYGGAEVAIDSVGAVAPGDVRSQAAAGPGVLVLEWRRAGSERTEITLRFGADANGGGLPRFDGAHLALSPVTLSADGFAGRWDSGAAEQQAGGYFCAVRIAG
jgi:hypothetical protein